MERKLTGNRCIMLEIIALYFLTKRIGELADRKGQPRGKWKLFTVLGWFGFEFGGMSLMALILGDTSNLLILVIFGLLSAFGGYLLVRKQLEDYPDVEPMDELIDRIGEEDKNF